MADWQNILFTSSGEADSKAQRYLEALYQVIPNGALVLRMDEEYSVVYANAKYFSLLGYSPEEYLVSGIQGNFLRSVYPADIFLLQKNIEETSHSGGEFSLELQLFHKDRRLIWVSFNAVFIKKNGKSSELQVVLLDITEKKLWLEEATFFSCEDPALYTARCSVENNGCRYSKELEDVLADKQEHTLFDREITQFAFEFLTSAKDLGSTIRLLLEKCGKLFSVTDICIYENVEQFQMFELSYCWSHAPHSVCRQGARKLSYDDWLDLVDRVDERGILKINHCQSGDFDEPKRQFFSQLEMKSALFCALYQNDEFRGWMIVSDSEKSRQWSKEETESFYAVTRILSSYLLKIRQQEQAESLLDTAVNYDSLTGLMKLGKFKESVRRALEENPGRKYAIAYADIVNFKYVNDTYGYDVGDKILQQFADFIIKENQHAVCGCRDFADNFILLRQVPDEANLENIVTFRNAAFSDVVNRYYRGSNLLINTGVYTLEDRFVGVSEAIDNANIARKSIKGTLVSCAIYKQDMKQELLQAAQLTSAFNTAIKGREFIVFYQPKVSLESGAIVGAEALVRWRKPDGKLVPPNDFIPLFEKNGAIEKLDFYVYEAVLEQLRSWMENKSPMVPISINLSRCHSGNSNLLEEIMSLMHRYEIPPDYIEFEVTESAFSNHADRLILVLEKLREYGITISMDDFGSGYSYLNSLPDIPVNILKLDKDFLKESEKSAKRQEIIKQVVIMAKNIDLKVICEGVETEQQAGFLKAIGCDMAQGYYYARPMPIEEFSRILQQSEAPLYLA